MAVCNQKGGIGKSTFTTILASLWHYGQGLNCLVVDSDFPQWSIDQQRSRESAILLRSPYYKAMMTRRLREEGRGLWPILRTTPEKAGDALWEYVNGAPERIDIVLIDLPGTVSSPGVFGALAHADRIFVPMKADKMVMESSIAFAKAVRESIVEGGRFRTRGVHMFWTMIDRRERTPLYAQYEKALEVFALPKLETHVPYRSKFNKEILPAGGPVYRSTIFPPERTFAREAMLEELAREMLSVAGTGDHEAGV